MSNISTKRSATRTAKNKTLAGTKNFFGIRAFNNRHDIIRDIKASHPEPEIHGNKIWKAATLLVDFLEVDPPRKNTHVMDLGCGWGLSGIYCAQQHQARVTAVDADKNVFPYVKAHEKLNGVTLKKKVKRFEKITATDLEGVDEIIGSDICFWDELRDILYDVVQRAFDAGVQRVVLADPGRSPFLELVDRLNALYKTDLYEWDTSSPVTATGYVTEIFNVPNKNSNTKKQQRRRSR